MPSRPSSRSSPVKGRSVPASRRIWNSCGFSSSRHSFSVFDSGYIPSSSRSSPPVPTPIGPYPGGPPASWETMVSMHALITNDDGIDSPRLLPIAHAGLYASHEVLVAAPTTKYSGAGAYLGVDQEESAFKVSDGRPPGLSEKIESIALHATPALIAYCGVLEFFGPRPD